MIGPDAILREIPGLTRPELDLFLAQGWVRAEMGVTPGFNPVDVARIRLIVELRGALAIDDTTLPVILSLLDQLYTTRRQLRRVLTEAEPALRDRLLQVLTEV